MHLLAESLKVVIRERKRGELPPRSVSLYIGLRAGGRDVSKSVVVLLGSCIHKPRKPHKPICTCCCCQVLQHRGECNPTFSSSPLAASPVYMVPAESPVLLHFPLLCEKFKVVIFEILLCGFLIVFLAHLTKLFLPDPWGHPRVMT